MLFLDLEMIFIFVANQEIKSGNKKSGYKKSGNEKSNDRFLGNLETRKITIRTPRHEKKSSFQHFCIYNFVFWFLYLSRGEFFPFQISGLSFPGFFSISKFHFPYFVILSLLFLVSMLFFLLSKLFLE